MNPSSAIFQAILAMDAYNRIGGDVTVRNLAVDGTSLGNVAVSAIRGDNASGFLAVAYELQGTGQKIISFRGTDTPTANGGAEVRNFESNLSSGKDRTILDIQSQIAQNFIRSIVDRKIVGFLE